VPVVDVLMSGVKKQVENLREFITTPKGVFETVDEMIVDARMTGRELARTVRPSGLRGSLKGQRLRLRR